mmetsp:Transcript_15252/g.36300  ORF Transcript_15252/g.36300 Transcript_15252/m.36300 type:complete len:344 (-) Transcript_15252:92-1123(-)
MRTAASRLSSRITRSSTTSSCALDVSSVVPPAAPVPAALKAPQKAVRRPRSTGRSGGRSRDSHWPHAGRGHSRTRGITECRSISRRCLGAMNSMWAVRAPPISSARLSLANSPGTCSTAIAMRRYTESRIALSHMRNAVTLPPATLSSESPSPPASRAWRPASCPRYTCRSAGHISRAACAGPRAARHCGCQSACMHQSSRSGTVKAQSACGRAGCRGSAGAICPGGSCEPCCPAGGVRRTARSTICISWWTSQRASRPPMGDSAAAPPLDGSSANSCRKASALDTDCSRRCCLHESRIGARSHSMSCACSSGPTLSPATRRASCRTLRSPTRISLRCHKPWM